MIEHYEEANNAFRKTRLFALIFFIISPIIYLGVTLYVTAETVNPAANDLLLYMLLILSVVQPALYPLIERFQISQYKRLTESRMNVLQLYHTSSIIKYAMVEAVFVYAIAIYFVTGTTEHIWKFYIIGIFWAIIYWPRKTTFENFLTKAGYDGIQR